MSNEYQIAEYNQTAAALTELRSRYVRPYDVSTTAGMAEVKEALAAMEILPGEAIDRAYELGFNDGANAGLGDRS